MKTSILSKYLLEKQQKQLGMEPNCYSDEDLHLLVQTIVYVNCGHEEGVTPSDAKYKRWLAPLVNALYELGGSATRPKAMDKVFSMYGVTEKELAETYKSGTSKIKNELDWAMLALYSEGIMCGSERGVWALSDLGKRILISDELAGRIVAKENRIALARKNGEKEPEIDLSPYYRFRGEKQEPAEGGSNQIQESGSPKLTGDKQFWWLNANPKIWSFSNLGIGEAQSYTLYNENGNKRRIFQNFLDAKAGDMVIGYESTPVKQIVAIGRISGEQDGEQL